jgi:hypothetical protein
MDGFLDVGLPVAGLKVVAAIRNNMATGIAEFRELPNIPLTNLLRGRFNRASLREAIEGLVVSDLLMMSEDSFVGAIKQKDQLLARAWWRATLSEIRTAYMEFDNLRDSRGVIEIAVTKLQRLTGAAYPY